MKKLRIAHKIWLSICILMVGYFVSMLFGYIFGIKTGNRLNDISNDLFPITVESQKALSIFNEQIKLYKDAILTGDKQIIVQADKKSTEIITCLNNINENTWLLPEKQIEMQYIINKYEKFNKDASYVYLMMCEDSDEDQKIDSDSAYMKASELASETETIRNELLRHSESFASELQMELLKISKKTKKHSIWNLVFFIIIALITFSLTGLIIYKSINKPINFTLLMLKNIAKGEGDLTARMPISSNDEIGEMADLFNQFIAKLQTMIQEIARDANHVNQSSANLTSLSSQVSMGMADMKEQSIHVEKNTKEMSENVKHIAEASNHLNKNLSNISKTSGKIANKLNVVSKSANNFTNAIKHISENSQAGYQVSIKASKMAEDAMLSMNSLGNAAHEIGKVSGVIKKIAVQTNLLALNASIEASAAQEAGQGFAVVASKIKHFAMQSSRSAEDIARRISDVQNKTDRAIEAINNVSSIIAKLNESNTQIMKAVENQRKSSNDIAENISDIKNGASSIADSIASTSGDINKMSKQASKTANRLEAFASIIQSVKTTTDETNDSVTFVEKSAEDLSGIANRLQSLVVRFQV